MKQEIRFWTIQEYMKWKTEKYRELEFYSNRMKDPDNAFWYMDIKEHARILCELTK